MRKGQWPVLLNTGEVRRSSSARSTFETMATKTKKPINWQLSPAPESKDHFTLKSQYELYRRQAVGT